jgi:hypothetical protein
MQRSCSPSDSQWPTHPLRSLPRRVLRRGRLGAGLVANSGGQRVGRAAGEDRVWLQVQELSCVVTGGYREEVDVLDGPGVARPHAAGGLGCGAPGDSRDDGGGGLADLDIDRMGELVRVGERPTIRTRTGWR